MGAKTYSLSRMGLLLAGIALLSAVIFGARTNARPQVVTKEAPRPLWEIDLTKFGFQGRPPVKLDPAEHWGFATYQQGVTFTEPNVVVAFFVAHDDPPGAPVQRKALPTDPYRFVAVFLKASSGELIKKLEWSIPTESDFIPLPSFFPTTKGRFLVGIGKTLFLYSQNYTVLARYDASNELSPTISPAGDTVLLHGAQRVGEQWIRHFRLLDTGQLATAEFWQETSASRSDYAIWGNQLAWLEDRSLYFKTPKTEPRKIAESKVEFCGNWDFVSQNTIAAVDCSGQEELVLVTSDGRIVRKFELELEQINGPIIASQNGRRFAVPSHEWGSGRDGNPKKLIVRVFDANIEAPLLVLDVARHYGTGQNFGTPHGDTRFGWGGVALSPEGEQLAIKSGPVVQVYAVPSYAEPPAPKPQPETGFPEHKPSAPPAVAQEALGWLPKDTEIVLAANGPFMLPELARNENREAKEDDEEETQAMFRALPFGLFGMKGAEFEKHFRGEKVLLAMEGSRHVHSPSGLGLTPYEGCAIAVFASDISNRAWEFQIASAREIRRSMDIDGIKVSVFQEMMEQDEWTTYVAFPKPNIAVAASDENYLREVLARINGKAGKRALPVDLPEWKDVDASAAFWAVRHYDRTGAEEDPTSPFGGKKPANLPDEQAVGLTFHFDPSRSKTATIFYLSEDKDSLQHVQKGLFPVESEPAFKALQARYRQAGRGAVEGAFYLGRIEIAQLFMFVFMGLFGHAVYV